MIDAPHPSLLPPPARPRTLRAVTLVDLQRGYEQAALIVQQYGDQYLPVFERIERELAAHNTAAAARQRALAVARKTAIEPPRLMIEQRREE